MALPFLQEPGHSAQGHEAGQEEEGPGDERADGQDDLEDRPDDERGSMEEPPSPMKDAAESFSTFFVRRGPEASSRLKKKSEPPLWQSVQPLQPSDCWAGRTLWARGQVTGPAAAWSSDLSDPSFARRNTRPPEM
jgi:hypothetical protein